MEPPLTLQRKIVDFLIALPNIQDHDIREGFIHFAGLDSRLQSQVSFGGSSLQFFQSLVPRLIRYGKLEDGRDALEAILEHSKEFVGQDKRAYCDTLIQELRGQTTHQNTQDGLIMEPDGAATVLEFQDIPDEIFFRNIDFTKFSLLKVFGHTGESLVIELLAHFSRCDDEDLQKLLKQIDIRILLRNPEHATGRRAEGIAHTVKRIEEFQGQEFNNLRVQFYQDLPTFRGVVCYRKDSNDRIAAISFYHFPPNRASKRFPQSLHIDESKSSKNQLVDIFESWFDHFWGKTKDNKIHTIILDFDDTMADSHNIQIDAWIETIKAAQKQYNLTEENFCKGIRTHLSDKDALREKVQQIFFEQQHAKFIFDQIFCNVTESIREEIHQERFEFRQQKMEAVELFPCCSSILKKLAREYHIIIISATDEVMIRQCLEREKFKEEQSNLSNYFLHIFGKREPVFDWRDMERKSQLILKVLNILGIPKERMIYVGDNQGDFDACQRIGVDFIEAQLFSEIVQGVTNRSSLIESDEKRKVFTIWSEFPKVLKEVEQEKQDFRSY